MSGHLGTLPAVTNRRHEDPLRGLQKRAMNQRHSLTELLREVVALGGRTGSQELMDWARRELDGYEISDELPRYRQATAPLLMDGATSNAHIKGQALAAHSLPDFAHDDITNKVDLRMSLAQIEHLARTTASHDVVRLSPPGADDLVVYMNQSGQWTGHIERIYWAVSPVVFVGILEGVRTALVALTAQLESVTPSAALVPSREATSASVSVVIYGDRGKIKNLTINNAAKASSIATAQPEPSESGSRRRWVIWGSSVLGFATAGLAVMQVQGWSF